MFGIGRIVKERFPDRQIYHKSDGTVRYFAVTTEMQVGALLIACSIATWLTVSTVNLILSAREQQILEQRIASEQISERNAPRSVDDEFSYIVEGLNSLQEAVRQTRSQLTREQLELERITAENERLQRIASLSESDAQIVIEIFRLENERAALERRLENLGFTLLGAFISALVAFLIYVRTIGIMKKTEAD
ncbi:hypothetical protein [Glycocaulis alkaliphilus]|uniref:hypothetical protein n=1 Tax=Glycocaulis alkaliphilus TaxID=1434191 RepID=UPI000FDB4BBA|nr:hypothetical protein [Glycocaulis alkaliphilus]GGB64728.1 hypothetical protein GCM10007417_00560 [Glycocaulis alkaliphilus]